MHGMHEVIATIATLLISGVVPVNSDPPMSIVVVANCDDVAVDGGIVEEDTGADVAVSSESLSVGTMVVVSRGLLSVVDPDLELFIEEVANMVGVVLACAAHLVIITPGLYCTGHGHYSRHRPLCLCSKHLYKWHQCDELGWTRPSNASLCR